MIILLKSLGAIFVLFFIVGIFYCLLFCEGYVNNILYIDKNENLYFKERFKFKKMQKKSWLQLRFFRGYKISC